MPSSSISLRLGVALWLASASATAQVIAVSGGGPALAQAVATAPSGAVLMVAPDTYDAVSFALTKDVTIVAPQRATVRERIDALTGNPSFTVRLVGLTVSQIDLGGPYLVAGEIRTIGNLYLEDCRCTTIYVPFATPTRRVHIANSMALEGWFNDLRNVDAVIHDSTFTGFQWGKTAWQGLRVSGSLRAERIVVRSGISVNADGLVVDGPTTIVDSLIQGQSGTPPYNSWGVSIYNTPPGALTVWNCTLPQGVANAYTSRPLVAAEWQQRNWAIGTTAGLRLRSTPGAPMALVANLNLRPWQPPFAAEMLYVDPGSPWFLTALGVTDSQGLLPMSFAIPNVPAARHLDAWLTGVDFGGALLGTSIPIGGIIL